MPKTSAEHIEEILLQGYDPLYYRALYKQVLYAFGDSWDKEKEVGFTSGKIVECPDILAHQLEVGVSRRILNSQFISLSRVAYSQPDPVFPDVDRWMGEVRKQFFLTRGDSEGDPDGEWATEDAMVYMDGDGLGVGGCQIVLTTNPKTGLQRVGIQHVPATLTVWDRLERNPGRARWVAFIKHLSPEDAEARFGKKMATRYVRPLFDGMTGANELAEPLYMMRIVEYFDMGMGKKGVPTRAIIAEDLDGELLEHDENPFGCLPWAHYVHFVPPGMRRPIGRIIIQMATQEALNDVEKRMRTAMEKGPVDLFDLNQLDETDVGRYVDGDFDGTGIRMDSKPGAGKVWERVPGTEIAETTLAYKSSLEAQFTTDSGTSEFERGNFSASARTLGENQLVDERSQVQGVWSKLQMVQYQRRKVAKVLQVAALFDRDPVVLDIFGSPVTINDPRNPTSSIQAFLQTPSRVVIDADSMEFSDLMLKRQQKLAELGAIEDIVQAGLVSPQWFAEEKLQALGYDPQEAMREAPALQPKPQQPDPNEKLMIDYKDAPEDIKRQMEAAAGFQPSRIPVGAPGSSTEAPPQPPQGPQARPGYQARPKQPARR